MRRNFEIRKYLESDKNQCRSLWRELTETHREIYEDQTIGGEHPETYFDKHLAKVGPDNIWVAADGSQILGFVGLIMEEKEAEVEPLIVRSDSRRKGVGKALVDRVIAEAKEREITFLNVKPVARNSEAIKFFFKRGFKTLGYVELFMDFKGRKWKKGPTLFDRDFDF